MSRHVIVPEGEYDIDQVRTDWIGRSLGTAVGRYPVEFDPIRRYCHMTGDTNPLYLDPEVGRASPYGSTPSPHGMLRYFASAGPWPPVDGGEPGPIPKAVPKLGDRGVNMNVVWQYFRPAVVGDSLKTTWIVDDVYLKETRLDPKSVWIVTVGEVTNQHEQRVARCTNTALFHRPAHDAGDRHVTRNAPRNVAPEGELVGTFDMQLTPTSTVLQISGSQDWNRVHHDPGFAQSSGHDSIFYNTGWTEGMLFRVLTTYIGIRPWWLERLEMRMTGMNIPGDRVIASGRLVERTPDDGGVERQTVAVELANERAGRTTSGTAVVRCAPPDGMVGLR